ncbi:MAG: hypothetical protein PXY39_10035 [archaeon]|nr:hypothetical protein [archaeon]
MGFQSCACVSICAMIFLTDYSFTVPFGRTHVVIPFKLVPGQGWSREISLRDVSRKRTPNGASFERKRDFTIWV